MGVRKVYLDYNSIALRLDALADKVRRENFGAIAIVLRGGSFAGMHMAFLTGIPCYFIRYNRKTRKVRWVGEPAPLKCHVLLCEDFAGAGWTLIDCHAFLLEAGFHVKTLVVCQDSESATIPDFYCFDGTNNNEKYLLPWERHILAVREFDGREDHEYERVAWDLDGVFLSEVHGYFYSADLEATLKMRDNLPLAPFAPNVSIQDVIVTERPLRDKERTEEWLREHNLCVPVVFRDEDVQTHSKENDAKWKGQRALDLGCTHYVESDAEESVHIAVMYPELRTIWWNEGDPLSIKAAVTPCSHRPKGKQETVYLK